MNPQATRITVGDRSIDETALLTEVPHVQKEIETWATQNELWHDSGFAVPFLYFNDAPRIEETILLMPPPLAVVAEVSGEKALRAAY